jgi:hypothetical protein
VRTLPTTPAVTTAASTPTTTAPAVPRSARWAGQEILADPITAQVLHAAWSGDPAVVVPSPPGAGKTRLVAMLAAALADRAQLRVGIAAQTREQAVEIARRVGALTDTAALMWATAQPLPDSGATPVVRGARVRYPATGGGILIGTTARWLFSDPAVVACDVLVVDEAWQCTYGDLGALGAHAGQVVCVGDPGQIDPVITGDTSRWRTNPAGPHVPAPDGLLAAHGDAVGVVTLRHTWRLGPETTALVQPAFYPGLPFTSRRPPEHLADPNGTALPEVAHRVVTVTGGPGDPALTAACADRVREVLGTTLTTPAGQRQITADDVAVVCAHVTQAAAVRATLADLPTLLVGTANQLQGLERHAVVVLHPLAGYRDAEGFGTDTGRACVMLSRHRTHLTVVLDATTLAVLDAAPSDTPGVGTHRQVTAALLATPAV